MSSIEGRIKINITGHMTYLWELMKLLSNAFIICHIIGVLYYVLGVYEYYVLDDEASWIHTTITPYGDPLVNTTWNVKYMESLYWAQATVILFFKFKCIFLYNERPCINIFIR